MNMNKQTALDETNMREKEIMQAKLFAAMSQADGVVLDVEKLVSGALIEQVSNDTHKELWKEYSQSLSDAGNEKEIREHFKGLKAEPLSVRLGVLKMLSTIAMCDGMFHGLEKSLIDIATKEMNVPIHYADETQVAW